MRTWYVCLACGTLRLPPEGDGVVVDCGRPECAAVAGAMVRALGLPPERLADMARRAAGLEGEPRVPRDGRRARGRRAGAAPGTRSRLG
ncbi:hypothetical protein [Streptomyces yaizuensis]|uniref:Uncharacterized protein n=1 Tax=Streptomyces yaizuensis TaxID=2989713 RepID=A0ABQ5PAI7_9ACTN|nr:hypothetical protein [Streptomyces sp. YSPA8]GLF99562.1 hypothetical protein SYYSPA8_34715 [Streptomyces sp. YSPA8]